MSHSQHSTHDSSSSSSSPSSSPEHNIVPELPKANVFANDGSFLEMFKKYQTYQQKQNEEGKDKKEIKKDKVDSPSVPAELPGASSSRLPAIPIIGKRRGGKILPTGRVKKVKNDDELEGDVKPKDAWSVYMSEVKRYRETVCQSDDKTRPLVK